VKERYRASAQLSNNCEHVFAPKKDTSTSIKTREEDKKQQTLLKKNKKREEKKFRSFSKLSYFLLFCTHSVALSFVIFFLNRSGGNFSAPPRDDSETFKTSVAGQSNWNAYEGSSEKELTPEEKKAKAKAEEDASNARRAAAAAKMQAEREKAGYKGSIF
jgi:cytoskeletal protein RodZ